MTNMNLVVLSKSKSQQKTARGTDRVYYAKYFTCQDPSDPTTAYFFTEYNNNAEEGWLQIQIYQMITVPVSEKKPGNVDPRYNKNLNDEAFTRGFWINGFKKTDIVIGGFYSDRRTIPVSLSNVNFYPDYLSTKDGYIRISAGELGFSNFPMDFNKVQLDGDIRVSGIFEWHIRPFFEDGQRKFKKVLVYRDNSVDLAGSDLGNIKVVIQKTEDDKKMREIIEHIKSLLVGGRYLSIDDIEDMLRQNGIKGASAGGILEGLTFRKNYEPLFFKMLKEKQTTGKKIYYGARGFIFHINGKWVWEIPVYGSATYIFKDTISVGSLISFLANASKNEIITNENLQELSGYQKRVIHPKDAENEAYVERWFSDVMG